MALDPRKKLGHYEVVSSLGAGGMGEVYRAKDTKLGREVAIKLLLEEVSQDSERLARFEREARVLASLNHNNIASLHAFEKDGDTNFLVMELVEGEDLSDLLSHGRIPLGEGLLPEAAPGDVPLRLPKLRRRPSPTLRRDSPRSPLRAPPD